MNWAGARAFSTWRRLINTAHSKYGLHSNLTNLLVNSLMI